MTKFTPKHDLKALLINKICSEATNTPLPYYDSSSGSLYPEFRAEILKLDSVLEILAYAEKVWFDVHRVLGTKGVVSSLIGIGKASQEDIEFAEQLQISLAKVSQSAEQELSQKQTEINNKQNQINSFQNDLNSKDKELTNQEKQKKDLEQQITSLTKEKQAIEQSKKDLLTKLSNSINQNDYDNIKAELEKEKSKDIERERERERESPVNPPSLPPEKNNDETKEPEPNQKNSPKPDENNSDLTNLKKKLAEKNEIIKKLQAKEQQITKQKNIIIGITGATLLISVLIYSLLKLKKRKSRNK